MADTPINNSNLLSQLASALTEVANPTTDTNTDPEAKSGFCGAEERVSEDSCNSLYPAIGIAPSGTAGVVWTDSRDGNFEIYMKAVKSKVPQELVDAAANTVIDPNSGRAVNLPCSGFSSIMSLDDIVKVANPTSDKVVARLSGGKLEVNTITRTITLTGGADTDFQGLGVLPNSQIRILNGLNAGDDFIVSRILAANVLDLVYYDGPQNDTGFVYDITKNPTTDLTTEDVRLTCNASTSTYPDVVADSEGRYHIAYQDNETGNYEINYIQVYPACVGQKQCSGPIDIFGQITVADPAPGSSSQGGQDSDKDPRDGQPFFYGNINLPTSVPVASSSPLLRNGIHKLVKQAGGGTWTGVSLAADRTAWDAQIADLSLDAVPPFVATDSTPLMMPGDFGQKYFFSDVAILAQTPRDLKVEISKVVMPIKPKCSPSSPATPPTERTQDIVAAPKRPAPPTFSENDALAQVFASAVVQTDDSVPPYFTIDGDSSGTVFTNMLVTNSEGNTERLVFTPDNSDPSRIKFILGQRRCGSELCAVKASDDLLTSEPVPAQYQLTLQAWLGPSYLDDDTKLTSASLLGNKLFEHVYYFDPSSDISSYSIPAGELIVPAGRYVFFVLQIDNRLGAYYEATGGGHAVWSTDGDGEFTQYYQPWTLKPNFGLSLPVYFEGTLHIDETLGGGEGGGVGDQTGPGILKKLDVPFNGVVGIDYYPTTNQLVAAINGGTGAPNNFALINSGGQYAKYSDVSNITDDVQPFVVKATQNNFTSGDMYFGSGLPGGIVKQPSGGGDATNPWVVLPGESGVVRVTRDATGVFAGDILAATSTGGVWRIDANAKPSKLASVGSPLDTIITLPNIPSKYGPWAGKAVVGGPGQSKFWTVDPQGNTQSFDLGVKPKHARVVPENQNFFAIDEDEALYGAAALNFADKIGDIVVTQESPGTLWHIKWTGAEFRKAKLAEFGKLGRACFAPCGLKSISAVSSGGGGGSTSTTTCTDERLIKVAPQRLTDSAGDSKHPRMAIDPHDNIWMVFESDRTGSDEVFIAKYYGVCGKWNVSNLGGAETRLTNASANGAVARSPSVAVDSSGEAHVVYSSNDTEDGSFEVFYVRSLGGGRTFTPPLRITASSGNAYMPDVCVSTEDGVDRVTIVWHDDRFGQFEIMSAYKASGLWVSSAQGVADVRITAAARDSLFPRIAADSNGNLRVVYHDYRKDADSANVYMSTYVERTKRWDSSGQGGMDILLSATGTGGALHPDIAIDRTNGVFPVWQDDRAEGSDSAKQKIFGSYCVKTESAEECFEPIDETAVTIRKTLGNKKNDDKNAVVAAKPGVAPTEYTVNSTDVQLLAAAKGNNNPLADALASPAARAKLRELSADAALAGPQVTTSPDIHVLIRAPGATFYRIANEDGQYSEWKPFSATVDLDTMIVPWTLTSTNGLKTVAVQVQDAQFIYFPVLKQIILSMPLPNFRIEFFHDEGLTSPLSAFHGKPVAPEGDVFVKATSDATLAAPPTFDIISRGIRLIRNQSMTAIESASDSGETTETNAYKGRFHVNRDDGLFHRDGQARIIVHGTDSRGNSF